MSRTYCVSQLLGLGALFAALVALTGCLEETSGTDQDAIFSDTALSGGNADTTEIRELRLDAPRDAFDQYLLSPNTEFQIGWDLRFSDQPALEVFISPSRGTSHPETDRIYACDERIDPGSCRQSIVCAYDNRNRLQCAANGWSLGRSVTITRFLNHHDSYFVLRVSSTHNNLRQSATRSVRVALY